jgi:hypothetical protein
MNRNLTGLLAAVPLIAAVVACAQTKDGGAPGEKTASESQAQVYGCYAEYAPNAPFANDCAAYGYFLQRGYSSMEAAAMVGNFDGESGMDPTNSQTGGPGMGIAQWSAGARWSTYLSLYGAGNADNLSTQLQFVDWELHNTETAALTALQSAQNLADATTGFMADYEAPCCVDPGIDICAGGGYYDGYYCPPNCGNKRTSFAQAVLDNCGGAATCQYTCAANAANCPSSGQCCSFGSWACNPATGCLVEDGCSVPPPLPTAPYGLNPANDVTVGSSTTLTWADDGSATTYDIYMYYAPPGGAQSFYYQWTGQYGASFPFSPQFPGDYYTFYVQGCNASGCGPWSAPAQFYFPPSCQYTCAANGCSPNTCCPFGGWYCNGSTGCLVDDGCSSCQYTCAAYGYYAGECVNGWYCNGSCITYDGC